MSQKSTGGLLSTTCCARRSLHVLNKTFETECKRSIATRESYIEDFPNTSNCNLVCVTLHSDDFDKNTKITLIGDKAVSYSNCDISAEVDSDHTGSFRSNGCMEKASQIKLDNISESVEADMIDCSKKNIIDQEVREEETKNINFSRDKNNRDEKVERSTVNRGKKHINNSGNVHLELKNNEIEFKIDELLCNMIWSSDTDGEHHQNTFIETMAEENKEDTHSEGSNDFVELGEQINTTESELSTNDSYENNSFIDDSENENCKLLPGREYDLEINDDRKRNRIIKLSSGSDVSIVQLNKRKEKKSKKKKSRITRFENSSDEEPNESVENPNKKIIILENIKLQEMYNNELSEHVSTVICSEKNVRDKDTVTYQEVTSSLKTATRDTIAVMSNNSELIIEESRNKNNKSKRKQRNGEQNSNIYYNNVQITSKKSTVHGNDFKIETAKGKSNDCFNGRNIKQRKHWDRLNKMSSVTNKKFKKTIVKNIFDEKFKENQFHIKDFKSLMLYDRTRIRRMETWKLLKYKI